MFTAKNTSLKGPQAYRPVTTYNAAALTRHNQRWQIYVQICKRATINNYFNSRKQISRHLLEDKGICVLHRS